MDRKESRQVASSKSLSKSELLLFFLHQDNLMWSRLQTMGVIQIGAISSAYALRSTRWLSLSILFFGIVLTLLLFFLMKRDELMRTRIEEQLGALDYRVFRKWYAPIKGSEAAWIIIISLLAVDVILGVLVGFTTIL